MQVFSRMTPDNKLRLVLAHQRMGERVLVTGDGFNDGPALKAADVGVAMGNSLAVPLCVCFNVFVPHLFALLSCTGDSGTDMARQAAGLVLLNDDFPTIVTAIREGRKMMDNLVCVLCLLFFISVFICVRVCCVQVKALRFYLACKFALTLLFLIPIIVEDSYSMAPVHVIILECFMVVFYRVFVVVHTVLCSCDRTLVPQARSRLTPKTKT